MASLPQIPDVPVSTDRPSHLHYISSVRAFIFPPSSPSEATVRRAIDGLSLYLNLYDPVHLHQTLNLLRQISLLHPPFSPLVISSVLSFLHHRQPTAAGDRLLLDALVTLVSASAHGCSGGSLPATAGSILSSLLSSPTAAIRLRALKLMLLMANSDSCSNYRNALLGFLKDPYPLVRRAALDGLVCVSKMDSVGMCSLMTEGMYGCIVQLLLEEDEVVRLGAIRMVSECGQMLADANLELGYKEHSDEIFIHLCSMVRDMSMEIRVEAFLAVGRTRMVSEDVLLQTLSKKINQNESKSLRKLAGKGSMLSISSAAGAFVHGLEDEFYQVRRAACASMGSLIVFSLRFVDAAFDLLMDMLNDDVLDVRLQTLKTMLEMATYNHLKVQEKHMHMFLNVLMDTNSSIRHATRKLLRVMKLANLEIYRSLIDGLLTSLRTYPEDEADIFFVLFLIGKIHSDLGSNFVKECTQELMGPSSKGELGLDRPRIAALLVLAIGATSNEQLVSGIPTEVFSFALPFLGRISSSLKDVISRDSILFYLCRCSGFGSMASVINKLPNSEGEGEPMHGVEVLDLQCDIESRIHLICSSGHAWTTHLQDSLSDQRQVSAPIKVSSTKEASLSEVTHSVKLILKTVADVWPLIKSGHREEVQDILRSCKEALLLISGQSDGSVSNFASQYIKVIKLLAKIWEHLNPRKQIVMGNAVLDLILKKLDTNLEYMRYGYLGFSKEEEFHILKLILLSCLLRSLKVGTCCCITLRRIHAIISRMQTLCEPGHPEFCDFVKEVMHCCDGKNSEVSYPVPVSKLVDIFALEKIVFAGNFKQLKAVLHVLGNDSENPIPYIPGMPVGVTFQITLYNVSSEDRLWLMMALGDSVQYVFLDLCQFEGGEEVKKCTIEVPFYRTPKAASFTLQGCIGMESPSGDVTCLMRGQGGTKYKLIILSKVKDIYMVTIGCHG